MSQVGETGVIAEGSIRRPARRRRLLSACSGDRACIMLLARSAGDWWDRLKEDHEDLEDFLTGPAVRGPFAVPPGAADVAGREQF